MREDGLGVAVREVFVDVREVQSVGESAPEGDWERFDLVGEDFGLAALELHGGGGEEVDWLESTIS